MNGDGKSAQRFEHGPALQLDPALERWLSAGAGRNTPCQRRVDTSISGVFLYPEFVLKLKKPVDFRFVDFTTLDKRHWAAERELEFNRATAPHIYRAVRAIMRDADGDFALGGDGKVIDWALEMRRFDETEVLTERPELVVGDFAEHLGRRIAHMHARAPRGSKGGRRTGSSRRRRLQRARFLGSGIRHHCGIAPDVGHCRVSAEVDRAEQHADAAIAP